MNIFYVVGLLLTFFLIKVGYAWSAEDLNSQKVWITIDKDSIQNKAVQNFPSWKEINSSNDLILAQIDKKFIPLLSTIMHENFHRCGGFMAYSNLKSAQFDFLKQDEWKYLTRGCLGFDSGPYA